MISISFTNSYQVELSAYQEQNSKLNGVIVELQEQNNNLHQQVEILQNDVLNLESKFSDYNYNDHFNDLPLSIFIINEHGIF